MKKRKERKRNEVGYKSGPILHLIELARWWNETGRLIANGKRKSK